MSTRVRSSMRNSERRKFSYPLKSVKIDQEHHRTLRSNKPTFSDMAAQLGALNASTPETTDGVKPEDRTARRALKDSERRLRPLKKVKEACRSRHANNGLAGEAG